MAKSAELLPGLRCLGSCIEVFVSHAKTRALYTRTPSYVLPIKCPKNGIVGLRTGGSRGSTFVLERLDIRAATTTAMPKAATIPVVTAMLNPQWLTRNEEKLRNSFYEVRCGVIIYEPGIRVRLSMV